MSKLSTPVHTKIGFREATDALFDRVSHDALADALGVSVASIRQARLKLDAAAHRTPPPKWRAAVVELAEDRLRHYERLIEGLKPKDQA